MNPTNLAENLVASIGEITQNPKVIVSTTKFGRGLKAIADIKKGETIANFDGKIYSAKKASELPNDPPLFVQDHAVQFSDTQYRWSKYGTVLNHSCDPNCGINGMGADFRIVAMKPIRNGDELTYDYEMTEDSNWRMKCECGSPICRKVIGAYANMPLEIRKKYKCYVAEYLVEKYGNS
jgi:SET domain-containing protein